MTEQSAGESPLPEDEQPTGAFNAVRPEGDAELPPPGEDATPPVGGGDFVGQLERVAQDRPEVLIGGAFATGFVLAMLVRRLVR